MKAAIIGAGFIADFHADAYQQLRDVELSAICDVDASKAGEMALKYGCAAYSIAEDMLKIERPDLVSVCVPTFLHEYYVVMALKCGAHVLCEKPLALTMEACQRMADAANGMRRILMTGQVLRWWPEYLQISREIRRMGPPHFLSTQRLQYASRTSWMADPNKGGGALFDLYVHDLDFACSLLGFEPHIDAVSGIQGTEGSWRSLCTLLRWSNGTCAKIESSNLQPAKYPFTVHFRADYPAACMQYEFRAPVNIQRDARVQAEFTFFENGQVQQLAIAENAQVQAFAKEIEVFVQGVKQGRSPLPSEESIAVMSLVHHVKSMLEEMPVNSIGM